MRRSLGSGYRGPVTITTTSVRTLGALSAGLLALGMLAGCTPEPEPKPTETALFASDEEAFAAAEETYRAYLEATDEIDLSDPDTFKSTFDWLSGEAEANERKTLSNMHAQNITKTGTTSYVSFTPHAFDEVAGTVKASLCLDVSQVDLQDATGASVVPPDRPSLQPLSVIFTGGDTATGLTVSSSAATQGYSCDE